jgi:TIR domain
MASDLPKVLISYSHDSPEHKDRVLVLSNRLRGEGIDCTIDQYLLVPPEGWPRWMEKQIRESDFVLMVCTETYYRRVLGQPDPDRGGRGFFTDLRSGCNLQKRKREGATSKFPNAPTKRQSEAFCSVSANFVLLES